MNIREVKAAFSARLETAGVNAPSLAVCFVLEKVLCMTSFEMVLSAQKQVSREQYRQADRLICRLEQHEPLGYVLGQQQFLSLMLHVEPGVLIPRSETEELAQIAIETLRQYDDPRVLDLCTGSGALALAMKHGVPGAQVTACDLSDDALRIAGENAKRLELDISFVKSDLFQNIDGEFDLIVSNPPYIPSADCLTLDRNVRDYEPRMALDGGADGLDFYRAIAQKSSGYLKADGHLMLEVGFDQAASVMELLQNDFYDIHTVRDMQGIERMILARRKGGCDA